MLFRSKRTAYYVLIMNFYDSVENHFNQKLRLSREEKNRYLFEKFIELKEDFDRDRVKHNPEACYLDMKAGNIRWDHHNKKLILIDLGSFGTVYNRGDGKDNIATYPPIRCKNGYCDCIEFIQKYVIEITLVEIYCKINDLHELPADFTHGSPYTDRTLKIRRGAFIESLPKELHEQIPHVIQDLQ